MKFRYLLLIAIALVIPAQFASATPVDPTIIVNRCSHCDAITFSMNSITDPLVITLNSEGLLPPLDLDYTGPDKTNLFIALADSLPFEAFDCGPSNVFTGCKFISTVGTKFSNDVEIEFLGPLDKGFFSVEVNTPEPSTIVLLATGGLLLIGLGRKLF